MGYEVADEMATMTSRHDGGLRTDVGFFGPRGSRTFGSLNFPTRPPIGGVVISPPLHADFAKNYRNEVLLGRALAQRGFAVLRFHYRGQGHSDGDPSRMTLESLKDDTLAAAAFLPATVRIDRLGLVGCRLGGLVAAAAASSLGDVPLSLWEPVLDPARYLREASRARQIGELGGRGGTSSGSLMDELRQGFVDIHGYPIHLALMESLEGRMLVNELGTRQRPILLVRISRRRELGQYGDVVGTWSSWGFPIRVHHVAGEVGWWFRGGSQDRDDATRIGEEAAGATADWMGEHAVNGQVVR
jgi:pimeloyl-ACP methyl ester carboxylesterase